MSVCSYTYSFKDGSEEECCWDSRSRTRVGSVGGKRRRDTIDSNSYGYSGDESPEEEERIRYSKRRRSNEEEEEGVEYRRGNDRGAGTEQDGNVINDRTTLSDVGRRNIAEYFASFEGAESESSQRTPARIEEAYLLDAARDYRYVESDEIEEDRIRSVFHEGFSEMPPRRRILHDVYQKVHRRGNDGLDLLGLHRTYTGGVLIITSHDDHYHVVHDCSYSNQSCRCAFTEYFRRTGGVGRRWARRVIPNYEYGIEHWVSCAKYFEKGTRQIDYMELSRRVWIPSSQARCLRFQEDLRNAKGPVVERGDIPQHVLDFLNCGSEADIDRQTSGSSGNGPAKDQGTTQGGKADQIVRFLQCRPTSPVGHIFSTSLWLRSKYRWLDVGSVMMKNIVRVVNNFYNELSVVDLFNHFNSLDPANLIFNAPLGNIGDYYFTIAESVEILNRLLLYQFADNENKVIKFLWDLFNVLDKKVPKKNTIFILSNPNAGKNFFFDAVLHFAVNLYNI